MSKGFRTTLAFMLFVFSSYGYGQSQEKNSCELSIPKGFPALELNLKQDLGDIPSTCSDKFKIAYDCCANPKQSNKNCQDPEMLKWLSQRDQPDFASGFSARCESLVQDCSASCSAALSDHAATMEKEKSFISKREYRALGRIAERIKSVGSSCAATLHSMVQVKNSCRIPATANR